MNVDREIVRPGISFEGRSGLFLGPIIAEVEAGFQMNWIRLDSVAPTNTTETLKDFYIGIGVRLPITTIANILTPYISAAFDANFWHFLETSYGCGFWYCSGYDTYRFAPGFSGRVGFEIKVNPMIAIDLGTRIAMTFKGNFWPDSQWWFAPFLGVTINR